MIQYIIHTVVLQMLFLIIYDVFLKRETFFSWNRYYLITTAIASLVLPAVKIQFFSEIIPKQYRVVLPELILGTPQSDEIISSSLFSGYWIFGLGMLIALIVFSYKLFKILRLAYKSAKEKQEDIYIVTLVKSEDAFSFFNYIFLGEHISEHQKEHIITHELAHVKGKHSIDLLLFEGLKIFFWYNPFIYVYQNRIASIHEFIADAEVIKTSNKTSYYQNLLAQVFDTKNVSFINPFYKESLIKKRIVMLQKTKSKSGQLLKYALLIPVISGMLVYNSCIDDNELNEVQESKIEIENNTTVDEAEEIPFATIEHVPVFSGCEGIDSQEESRRCFNEKMRAFVAQNFDLKIADKLKLKGEQKISVFFKISATGDVISLKSRAIHPDLENEAKRVINLLPKFKPGIKNGKAVTVPYYLPIKFVVK